MNYEFQQDPNVYGDNDQQKNYETAMQSMRKYIGTPEYDRVAITASAMASKGKYLEAVKWISNFISSMENGGLAENKVTKDSNKNLVNEEVLRILAERVNPVITKGELMEIVQKKK